MKFDMVTIKNFRNFENISVALTNKNVLFGMNDVGKTNFLYALRFVTPVRLSQISLKKSRSAVLRKSPGAEAQNLICA